MEDQQNKELLIRAFNYLKSRKLSTKEVKGDMVIQIQNNVIPSADVEFVFEQILDGDLMDFFEKVNKHRSEKDQF